jgi:hypothetical protein
MDLKAQLDAAIAASMVRPKGVRLSVSTFNELEQLGHITRASGGPLGLDWFKNLPWFDGDIYAWCDPTFEDAFEIPTLGGVPET